MEELLKISGTKRKYGRVPANEIIQKIHLNNLATKRRLICDRLAEKDYETVSILRSIT